MYCQKQGCGGLGMCASRPNVCPAIYAPVCGCVGKTYGNACEAAAAAQNAAAQGECPCPPIQCAAPKVPVVTNGQAAKNWPLEVIGPKSYVQFNAWRIGLCCHATRAPWGAVREGLGSRRPRTFDTSEAN
jgi:hypothetical protein